MLWHIAEISALQKAFKTDLQNGLTNRQVLEFAKQYGKNIISDKSKFNLKKSIYSQVKNPLITALFIVGILFLFFGKFVDFVVILFVVMFNLALSVYQQYKTHKTLDSLQKSYVQNITVIRNGKKQLIDARDLVPGDIVYIQSGDAVPADIRLINSNNLQVSESQLTGEFNSIQKDANYKPDKQAQITDQKNMLFAGSAVLSGEGIGLVVETGKNTYIGKLAKQDIVSEDSFFDKVRDLVFRLFYISVAIVLLVLFVGFSAEIPFSELLVVGLSLVIASVPEGILALVSLVLAVSSSVVLKKGVLVKSMQALHSLGSVSVILTDKTGTLTEGKMFLEKIATMKKVLSIDVSDLDSDFVLKLAILASDAYIDKSSGENKVVGRPIESAIVSAGIKKELLQDNLFENGYKRLDFRKFSSSTRFATSLNEFSGYGNVMILTGEPESIFNLSNFYHLNQTRFNFTPEQKDHILTMLKEFAAQGKKITAIAYKSVQTDRILDIDLKEKDFIFAGFLIFDDKIKEGVKDYIQEAEKMFIKTIMITGDHKETAKKIAYFAGLIKNKDEEVILGKQIEHATEEQILSYVRKYKIFARMLPHHKLKIVQTLKKHGEMVAMIGDGVNDVPSLKAAHVSVAVAGATEVAKQASDLVILHGGFNALIEAVKQGRRVITNIKKITTNLVSGTYVLSLSVLLSYFSKLPTIFTPIQILWFNMINESVTMFPIAFEKKEANVYKRPTSDFIRNIVDMNMIKYLIAVSVILSLYLFFVYYSIIESVATYTARSVAFFTAVMISIALLVSLSKFSKFVWNKNYFNNKMLIRGIVLSVIMLVLVFKVPALSFVLGLDGFDFRYLLIGFWGFVIALAVSEFFKYLFFIKANKM